MPAPMIERKRKRYHLFEKNECVACCKCGKPFISDRYNDGAVCKECQPAKPPQIVMPVRIRSTPASEVKLRSSYGPFVVRVAHPNGFSMFGAGV